MKHIHDAHNLTKQQHTVLFPIVFSVYLLIFPQRNSLGLK